MSMSLSMSMDNVDDTPDREASGDINDDINGTANNSSSNSPAASTNAAHTRRSHKKSRNGCSECKRRHIRCDERRPSCANCAIAERACSFPPPKRNKPRQRKRNQVGSPAPSAGSLYHQPDQSREQSLQRELTAPRSVEAQTQPRSLSQNRHRQNQRQTQTQFQHLSINDGSQADTSPSTSSPQLHSHSQSHSQPHSQPQSPVEAGYYPQLAGATNPDGPPLYTSQHLALLRHASVALDNSIMGTSQSTHAVDIAVRWAVIAPYLMDQVLAISALHLAKSQPASAASLRHQATELQTRAVASFTRSTEDVSVEDTALCVPRFLFSGILNLHVLTETLTHHSSDFHAFIDRFAECIHLHRGIMSLIRPTWDYLESSELRPLLSVTKDISDDLKGNPGTECAKLEELINSSDLGTASIAACRDAIECLQWAFDMHSRLPLTHTPRAASAFSVKLGAEFVDVLLKHRPEALVILAYYGVLLHRSRSYWAYGDGGMRIIRAISMHLGSFWRDAIAWPLEVLETEYD